MTNTRAIEMFIKPNFKYFLIPFGCPYVRSTYTFNSLREAKAYAEKKNCGLKRNNVMTSSTCITEMKKVIMVVDGGRKEYSD